MTQTYDDAVLEAETLWQYASVQGPLVEQLVAIGYRAALKDAVQSVQSFQTPEVEHVKEQSMRGAAARGHVTAKRIVLEKLASIARKFEGRAKELKV